MRSIPARFGSAPSRSRLGNTTPLTGAATIRERVGANHNRRDFGRSTLERPPPQTRPYRVPGADGGEQDDVAFLQAALRDRVARAQRDGAGGRIAETVDVD